MTPEELDAAITVFRQETEDLINIVVKEMFMIQYGAIEVTADNPTAITFEVYPTYGTADEYELRFVAATDADGVNILDALELVDKTATGFIFTSPRNATVRWQTSLKVPFKDYYTL